MPPCLLQAPVCSVYLFNALSLSIVSLLFMCVERCVCFYAFMFYVFVSMLYVCIVLDVLFNTPGPCELVV